MNTHLNIYKTYSKINRETRQLEDDLTRALAIALQENDVFSHQFLKYILNNKEKTYENLFDDFNFENPIVIDIQKEVKSIEGFDHLFAVRISGSEMEDNFFTQQHNKDYNAITDLFIQIDNIVLIFEIKPNNVDSTAQLYNQAYNTINNIEELSLEENVTPVDFNWSKLMEVAVRVNNYQEAIGKPSRLLHNFISYVKAHNYEWFPVLPLSALSFQNNRKNIKRRFSDAIDNSENQSIGINNRLGIKCTFRWAQEILIYIRESKDEVAFAVYPGNTKGQGYFIFKEEGEPPFKKEVVVNGKTRQIIKKYHIKFSGQGYITGLWAEEKHFKNTLYTKENFHKHSGRKYRELHWQEIENLLNYSFKEEYNWKEKSNWKEKIKDSNRTRFDVSFGYELSFTIPYRELQQLDDDKNNLDSLIKLIDEAKRTFKNILLD